MIPPLSHFSALLVGVVTLAHLTARVELPVSEVPPRPERWVRVPDLPKELMLVESVFWEPLDTLSLRQLIRERPILVRGKSVLEVGTGSGLIAFCCARGGAKRVVATDINPNAIRCARWNADNLELDQVEFRLVRAEESDESGAYSVVLPAEHFDLVVSNPPWENARPRQWSDFALYDTGFQLLRSLLEGFRGHTNPGAKMLLAYGCRDAIRAVRRMAPKSGLSVVVLDDRDPESEPDVFLPGILLGLQTSTPMSVDHR